MIASVGTLRVWDARRGSVRRRFPATVGCLWFPDGKHFAAAGAAGGVYFMRFEQEDDSTSVEPAMELSMRDKTPS